MSLWNTVYMHDSNLQCKACLLFPWQSTLPCNQHMNSRSSMSLPNTVDKQGLPKPNNPEFLSRMQNILLYSQHRERKKEQMKD